jgi:hypothetical protein
MVRAYCPPGSAVPSLCPAGHYCPVNSNLPQPCTAGTYNPNTGSLKQSACVACRPGTFNNQTGQAACTPCKAGTYSPNTGSASDCMACAVGTYADSPGQAFCRQGCEFTADNAPTTECFYDALANAEVGGLALSHLYTVNPASCGMAFTHSDTGAVWGVVSAPGIMYNDGNVTISSSGTKFHFLSAYMTPLWRQAGPMVITLVGYRDGVEVGRYVSPPLLLDASGTAPPVRYDFETTFYNIDTLTLSGGDVMMSGENKCVRKPQAADSRAATLMSEMDA